MMTAIRTVIRIIIYGFTKRSSGRVRTVHEIVAEMMVNMSRGRNV
jgi:hypothetical protein